MNPHLANKTDAARIAAASKILEAEQEKVRTLELRIKRLERTIRTFLHAETLTDPQRAELVDLLAGLGPAGKAPVDGKFAGLTPAELKIVDHYRTMDTGGMQLLSRLAEIFARLARVEAKKKGGR